MFIFKPFPQEERKEVEKGGVGKGSDDSGQAGRSDPASQAGQSSRQAPVPAARSIVHLLIVTHSYK